MKDQPLCAVCAGSTGYVRVARFLLIQPDNPGHQGIMVCRAHKSPTAERMARPVLICRITRQKLVLDERTIKYDEESQSRSWRPY